MLAANLSPSQKKEFIIRDNVHHGDWDEDMLVRDWDTDKLNDWGLDFASYSGKVASKKKELVGYKKIHVLISMDPNDFHQVQDLLDQIKQTGVAEYEQTAN